MNKKAIKTVWSVIYPFLIYAGISIVTQIVFIVPEMMKMIRVSDSMSYETLSMNLSRYIYHHTMLITLISGIITIPALYYFFYHDRKCIDKVQNTVVPLSCSLYLLPCLIGIFMCVSLNNLIDLSKIINFSPTYQQLESEVFGDNVILTFITSVLMAPILEELLFRGLIYKRLRCICNPVVAALLSATAFGITHGNLVQFVYAFMAGLILAFLYQKYKNILAPMLAHLFANTVSVVGTGVTDELSRAFIYKICAFMIELIILILLCRVVQKKVKRTYTVDNYRELGKE